MKSAQSQIREILGGRKIPSNEERLQSLLSNIAIKSFQKQNPDIPLEAYKRSIPKLSQFVREQENCAKCTGLETCKNIFPGRRSELVGYKTYIDLRMPKCERLKAFEEMKKRQELFKSHKIPKSVLSSTFDTIDLDERKDVIDQALEYCTLFEQGTPKHGLYLHGNFGVGKSHIAAAIANYLTGLGIDCFMVYVPDFVQEVYQSIQKGNTHQLVDAVKEVKVLILDDIGAENLNPWIRDEIFGSILQHRMTEELTTIFTSNLSLDELQEHLAYTNKGGRDELKAKRIMERIKHYVKPLEVPGRNRRENNL